eukprot:CAMPEP_0183290850 /NCGR_PEP_ID=MMETSP0160_2-20130417/435_1 /TAXON_ID=2839 ORGANISM="Odontella Sinensis, Strain Grunow 1884" /NCGR_SAMPLE_ID=MMETSP0160_2 /ASSEMBLY_ACC=CAM_ASM_000250 /LENGTH=223 /DNA_ID=CAMNT_0025451533 /DNA_START=103 /DNA_END=774 /DNA_ORIENTATION=+
MKLAAALLLPAAASAFAPTPAFRVSATSLSIGSDPNVFTGGNSWKPDSEKMGSTDTGDYFPEGYDPNAVEFTEGMMGSSGMGGGDRGPQLPGMENLGEDALMMGGIEVDPNIPEGMEFIPSSVPDGELNMQVASNGGGVTEVVSVAPVCMTFEDYYAAFAPGSHPSFSVGPSTGRMDRRGGEPSILEVTCEPRGQAGTFTGDLVINLPEDNSKICYKVTAQCF